VEVAINGALFQAWVEQHLSKVLRPGDSVAAAIEAVGAKVLYLPPYSPDLSPIELAFSKFKKLLRDGAERTMKYSGDCVELSSTYSLKPNAVTTSSIADTAILRRRTH
jgi:hypothetical protein